MIADIITFGITHPFIAGMFVGGCAFGVPLGIIGWCVGHDAAMHKINGWMFPPKDEAHGDVPKLPPVRERRFIPTTGRWS
jgi:hypothetical protein